MAVIMMQAAGGLFFNNNYYSLNARFVFGWWGDNIVAIIFSFCFIALILWAYRRRIFGNQWALLLLLSGAISNVLDRIVYGGVIDYLDLFFLPRFNLADLAIILGVIIWIWSLLRSGGEDKKTNTSIH